MKKGSFTLFVIVMLLFTKVAMAQSISSLSDLTLETIPENPTAGETVTATVSSYSTNINLATISWLINGVVKKSGTGEKTFTFVVEQSGNTNLTARVTSVEGDSNQKSFTIKPSSGIDLIWETDSFTPPFYKGKAMFSHQNNVTFIAIPHITNSSGREIDPKNLVYKWTKNGSVQESASGYGKNSYSFTSPLISRGLNIEVTAESSDGSTANKKISLNPQNPSIIFYKKDPLYGIELQKALSQNELLNGPEISVVAMPLFFGTLNMNTPEISYKWSINNQVIANGGENTQVFRKPENSSGTSKISVSIENTNKILQYTSGSFNLSFGDMLEKEVSF